MMSAGISGDELAASLMSELSWMSMFGNRLPECLLRKRPRAF